MKHSAKYSGRLI